jgi:flagellar hook-associated protein 3 FlgL
MIRLTDALRIHFATHSTLRAGRELANATRSAVVGQRVLEPSDDPSKYGSAVRRGAEIEGLESRARAARTAQSGLALAERALDAFGEVMVQARELALQGTNQTLNATDRAALGAQVLRLREHAISIANTRGPEGFIFGGARTDVAPFDTAGAFLGNDVARNVPLGKELSVRANASGASAFTAAGGDDAFAALGDLAAALNANDVDLTRAALPTIENVHLQVVREQSDVGGRMVRLEAFADVADGAILTLHEWQSRDVGADEQVAIMSRLQNAQTGYERSLEISRRILAALEQT